MLSFLLFAFLLAVLLYLHFAPAHLAWLLLRGRYASEINMGYLRAEDYFGQSFRALVEDWLHLPAVIESPHLRVVNRGNERVFVASSSSYPDLRRECEVLVLKGDFTCGARCEFEKELYVQGDCEIGPRSRLRDVAVDGALTLGHGSEVHRWVDAAGPLIIASGVRIHSRTVSRTFILLGAGASALSLHAPEIRSEGFREAIPRRDLPRRDVIEIPVPSYPAVYGYDASRLHRMSDNTYLYDGDLLLEAPAVVRCSLVVRGDVYLPSESLLEGSLKARGSIHIDASSVARANVVAEGDLLLGPGCFFQGLLSARGTLRLSRGVRGMSEETPVAAFSSGPLEIESNVIVCGKLASQSRVQAISSPLVWLDLQYPLPGVNAARGTRRP
jgi:predicted acyltransferase (DUF342 family)